MNKIKPIIIKVLDIVGYEGDEEKFVVKFLENVQLQAVADLASTLSQETQDKIKHGANIGEYFSKEQFAQALKDATKKAFVEYLQGLKNLLSPSQKTDLTKLLSEISSTT